MMLERFSEPPAQSCLPLPCLHGGVRMVVVVGMCGKIACTTADAPMTPGEEFDEGSEDEGDGVATLALHRPLTLMTMAAVLIETVPREEMGHLGVYPHVEPLAHGRSGGQADTVAAAETIATGA